MEMDGGGKGVNLFYFFDPSLAINGERSNCTRHSWPANHGSFCNIAPANNISFSGRQIQPFENYGAACNLYKQSAITHRYTIIVLDVKY